MIYAPPPRDMDSLTRLYRSRLEWIPAVRAHSISSRSAPDAADRAAMTARRNAVADTLAPSNPGDAARLVSVMFSGFQGARTSDDEARQRVALYVSQVKSYPTWAIKSACSRFLAGVAGSNAAFAPSVAELAKACAAESEAARVELSDLNAILNAGVIAEPDDSARDRMRAAMADLVSELSQSADPTARRERPPTRQEAREWLTEAREAGAPAPQMSDDLRSHMGLPPTSDAREAV